jgi:hypothetical protein
MEDYCDHGVHVDHFCMLCCREGEGKPASKDESPPMSFEECMSQPGPGESPWD